MKYTGWHLIKDYSFAKREENRMITRGKKSTTGKQLISDKLADNALNSVAAVLTLTGS